MLKVRGAQLLATFVLFFYFVLPKSLVFSFSGIHKDIGQALELWSMQRFALLGLCSIYILYGLFSARYPRMYYTFGLILIIFFLPQLYSWNLAGLYGVIGSCAAVMLLRVDDGGHIHRIRFLAYVFCTVYLAQYCIYTLNGRPVSSFIDANIAGYYLFLCYVLFRISGIKVLSVLAICAGVLSLSRNFVLAVFVFELFYNVRLLDAFLARIRNPGVSLSIASLVLVFSVGHYFERTVDDVASNSGDFGRMVNIVDQSNKNRFEANNTFVGNLFDGQYVVYGAGAEKIDDEHRPHNAFLRSIYRYGLPLSVILFFAFVLVANKFYAESSAHRSFLLALFTYYSLLNDFITGTELVLLVCICALLPTEKRETRKVLR